MSNGHNIKSYAVQQGGLDEDGNYIEKWLRKKARGHGPIAKDAKYLLKELGYKDCNEPEEGYENED